MSSLVHFKWTEAKWKIILCSAENFLPFMESGQRKLFGRFSLKDEIFDLINMWFNIFQFQFSIN